MRKLSIIILGLAVAAFVGSAAYAGCGSCPGDAAKTAGCSKTDCAGGKCDACSAKKGCGECLKGLELTAEQQAALKELTAKCKATECTETSKKEYHAGLKKILTADQLKSLKKHCADKGCKELAPVAALTTLQFAGGGCGSKCGDKNKDGEETASFSALQFAGGGCGSKCGDKNKDGEETASFTALQFAGGNCGTKCGDKNKDGEETASLTFQLA